MLLIAVAVAVALTVYWGSGLEPALAKGLAILSLIAILWVTEAIHITATALLVPIVAAISGVLSIDEALVSFADPIIFLFLGGFALAAAMRKQGLDQWLALHVIKLARGRLIVAIVLLFVATAFLSMWISNTATAVMMLPIVFGLLANLDKEHYRATFTFVLLGIAYSANIGGIGTIVGSPPNAIAASILGLDFVEWMAIGVPLVIVLLPAMILTLWLCIRPQLPAMSDKTLEVTPWGQQTWWVLFIFIAVVSCWLMSKPISEWLDITQSFDTIVALTAIIVLLASGLLKWKELESSTDWGVLLLFGGGITLSVVLAKTGASTFLADQLVAIFAGGSALLFLALAVALMIFLTELASNTASAALLIPIFYSLPQSQIGVSPELLSIAIAVAASCAFMLPVATPPNAIVYGTGLVMQRQMIRVGLFLNVICIVLITLLMPWLR
ncbi:SLC13 family permease [Dasania marina]|uniref:SLC13 family permease n=1 Tax=Dasania marina TaxID=471499 RepID=UPI000364EF98|nr:DASS family sodium-coupled anion symporter [Dasania marina]